MKTGSEDHLYIQGPHCLLENQLFPPGENFRITFFEPQNKDLYPGLSKSLISPEL